MKKLVLAILAVLFLLSFEARAQLSVSTVPTTGLNEPYNVVEDTNHNIYISDSYNNRIIKLDGLNQAQSILVGTTGSAGTSDGPAIAAQFNDPQGLLPVTIGGTPGLLVADTGNQLIRFVRLSDAYVFTLAGQAGVGGSTDSAIGINATFTTPTGLTQDTNGNVYISDLQTSKIRVMNLNDPNFGVSSVAITGTTLYQPTAVAFMGTNQLWVADTGNNAVKLITLSSTANGSLTSYMGSNNRQALGSVTTDSLYGPSARFNQPRGLLWIPGFGLLISDTGNNSIRRATNNPAYGATNYAVATYAGTPGTVGSADGILLSAKFNSPEGLCLDPAYGAFLVADLYNNSIRRILTGLPPPPPPAPIILTVTPSLGLVNLTWSTLSTATNYNVKRSGSSGTETLLATTTSTDYSDTNVLNGSTYFYVVSASNAGGEGPNSAEVSATVPLPPIPNPQIGYVDFPATATPVAYTSVFHPVASYDFYNDAYIVIKGTPGSGTSYTYDGSTPTTNSLSIPSDYQDGKSQSDVSFYTVSQVAPSLTIKAMGWKADGSPSSAVVTATFRFITGNPGISGNNAAQFTVSDITTNAQMWFTTNGVDPTNISSSTNFGPISAGQIISLNIAADITFKIRAFKDNYQPSGVVSGLFSATNFVANKISFGFESGEASSDFVGSSGQFFYAPVTLTVLSGVNMFGFQFNAAATNLNAPPIPAGVIAFKSMLMKPIPNVTPVIFEPIPPAMYVSSFNVPNPVYLDGSTDFSSLLVTNSTLNLLGVGWLERAGNTNLYDTTKQDVITYSMAHDTLFPSSAGKVVVGGFAFRIPATTNGAQYQIKIGRPSATSDGIGGPGSDVYISSPTNGSLAGGAVNSIKNITVGQRKYIAGSVYPFRWFNAGDFGSINIVNADVMQVFQSAVYGLNSPPPGSDFEDAMDSCGNIGVLDSNAADANFGYYTNAAQYPYTTNYTFTNYTYTFDSDTNPVPISTGTGTFAIAYHIYIDTASITAYSLDTYIRPSSTNVVQVLNTRYLPPNQYVPALFDGNDTNINQIVFGDGILDVCDVYVTFRRSLDPSLTWYRRFWNIGQRVADTGVTNHSANAASMTASLPPAPVQAKLASASPAVMPQVNFAAGDATNGPGQTVLIPITATIFGSYPLRALMLNLTVEPLDGSPALTTAVQFTPVKALGTPYTADQQGANNYSAVWLDNSIPGLTGTAIIGTLQITLPTNAPANAAYAVHFDHASGSPNGLASFPKTTFTGLVTLSARSASSYGDGIPDSWRLRWFGTIYNQLSRSNACPTGDGINNWKKYVAGVNPSIANNFPSVNPRTPAPSGSTTAIHWPSVSGKQYIIERSSTLFSGSWSAIATNTGTGTDMEFDDTNTGQSVFYRVRILP